MHLCLTAECITSGLHVSIFLIRSPPPPYTLGGGAQGLCKTRDLPPSLPAASTLLSRTRGQILATPPPPLGGRVFVRHATFVLTIPTLTLDLPSPRRAPQVDQEWAANLPYKARCISRNS